VRNNKKSGQAYDQSNKVDVGKERPIAYFFADKIGANGGDEIVFEHVAGKFALVEGSSNEITKQLSNRSSSYQV
jgi:hypothetical protein